MTIDKRAAAVATGVIGGLILLVSLASKYPLLVPVAFVTLGLAAIWYGIYLLARRS